MVAKTKAGLLPVDVREDAEDYAIVMTQGKTEVSEPLGAKVTARIAAALGLQLEDLRQDCPVAIASAGHSKVIRNWQERSRLIFPLSRGKPFTGKAP